MEDLAAADLKGDGRIDADERRIVEEVGAWMRVNGESLYGTRPWTSFGEGPALASAACHFSRKRCCCFSTTWGTKGSAWLARAVSLSRGTLLLPMTCRLME